MSKLGSKTLLNQTTNQQQKDHEQHTTDRTDRQIDRRGKMIDKERERQRQTKVSSSEIERRRVVARLFWLYTRHTICI